MRHHIFSDTLEFRSAHEKVSAEKMSLDRMEVIKKESDTDIYLCGGGRFAGWLLTHRMIDKVKVKRNPIILNDGVRLFEGCERSCTLQLLDQTLFDDGLQLITYQVNN